MVKKCCINACPSESYGGCNISFHIFPKNMEMNQKWLEITKMKRVTKNSVICGRHFEKTCFYFNNGRQYLKADAVPSIFPLPKSKEIVPDNIHHLQSVSSQMKILQPKNEEIVPDDMDVYLYIVSDDPQSVSSQIKILQPKIKGIVPDNIHHPQSVSSQIKILHPAASLETPDIASPSNIDEVPPSKKVRLDVKEVGVQTQISECNHPIVQELRRKVKILSLRLNRRTERLKKFQSILRLHKRKCKNFEENKM